MQTLASRFPGVPILPAIGNNDCYYHDLAPYDYAAQDYYSELKNVFFDEVPANTDLLSATFAG
jgi:hypothetical protein